MLQQFLPLTYHLYLLARSPIDLSSGASETMHRPQKVTDVAAIIQLFQSADIPFEHQDPDSLFLLSPAHGPLEDLCAMTEIDQSLFTLFPPLPQGPSTPFFERTPIQTLQQRPHPENFSSSRDSLASVQQVPEPHLAPYACVNPTALVLDLNQTSTYSNFAMASPEGKRPASSLRLEATNTFLDLPKRPLNLPRIHKPRRFNDETNVQHRPLQSTIAPHTSTLPGSWKPAANPKLQPSSSVTDDQTRGKSSRHMPTDAVKAVSKSKLQQATAHRMRSPYSTQKRHAQLSSNRKQVRPQCQPCTECQEICLRCQSDIGCTASNSDTRHRKRKHGNGKPGYRQFELSTDDSGRAVVREKIHTSRNSHGQRHSYA